MARKNIKLLCIIVIFVILLTSCSNEPESANTGNAENESTEIVQADIVTEEPEGDDQVSETENLVNPTMQPPSSVSSAPVTWLVMLYQDADDEVLEEDMFTDLNEAEMIGSSENVTIVSQMDRYKGGFDGDGDWTTVKRFLVGKDQDLEHIKSKEITDLGELDSGDPQTLVDFATWAIQTYPAQKYALILSDHGAGWVGGWYDNDPNEDSSFTTDKIDFALSQIINNTGIGQFEFLGFDACLMSQIEPLSAITPYGKYAAASEEVEPSLGWAYASFLSKLVQNPDMDGKELAKNIVSSYIDEDIVITDDAAREKFLSSASSNEKSMSAKDVARELSGDITITAIDLSAMPALNQAINNLALVLPEIKQNNIAKARTYAQSYKSIFGEDDPPSYIDLGHFTNVLMEWTKNDALSEQIKQIQGEISKVVITEKHGSLRPGSTGLSIFFPASQTYEWTGLPGSIPNYANYASRFAQASLWDEFLLFHYTGEPFDESRSDISVLNPIQPTKKAQPTEMAEQPEATEVTVEAEQPAPTEEIAEVEQPAATEETTEAEQPAPTEEVTEAEQPSATQETAEVEQLEATEVSEEAEQPTSVPSAEVVVTAPGSGEISISPIKISINKIKPSETLTLSTKITGTNIGYIYIYTLYYNESDNSYLTADVDFVDAGETQDINGVIYPDWGEDTDFQLDFEWTPTIYFMSDGNEKNDQFALFEPQIYGINSTDSVYQVSGTYIFSDGTSKRSAIMEFNGDGNIKRVLTFLKDNIIGAPREVKPKPGDQFIINDKWLEFTNNPDGELVNHDGGTMTFGEKPFTWVPYQAFPGKYAIGIVVEDLDGKSIEQWVEEIEVTE